MLFAQTKHDRHQNDTADVCLHGVFIVDRNKLVLINVFI